jgi:hypothetical protein
MIEQLNTGSETILSFQMKGRLRDEDYRKFVPIVEEAVKSQGKVRLLAQFQDFHGWDVFALWDEIKFAALHCFDIERIALIGDRRWEKWMARFCKPFTRARVRYFDSSQVDAAKNWLQEGVE